MKNYYELLGINVNAAETEIKSTIENLKNAPLLQRRGLSFVEIDEISKILLDSTRRKEYDTKLGISKGNAPVSTNQTPQPVHQTPTPANTVSQKGKPYKEEKFKQTDIYSINRPKILIGSAIPLMVFNPLLGGTVAVAGNILLWKTLKGKHYKPSKDKNYGHVTILTQEAEEIRKTNKTTEEEIEKLIVNPNNNYRLNILLIKYRNEQELLEKRIELRKNLVIKNPIRNIKNNIELMSLINQLKTAKERCKEYEKKVKNFKSKFPSMLSEANKKLSKRINAYDEAVNDDLRLKSEIKSLEIRKSRALTRRNVLASRVKLRKYNFIADGALYARDFVVGFIEALDKDKVAAAKAK